MSEQSDKFAALVFGHTQCDSFARASPDTPMKLYTPPDRPVHLEPHHRISKDPAFKLLCEAIDRCAELGFEIDSSVNTASKATLFSMPYIACSEGGFCHFWISVFKDNNTDGVDRYVIEFRLSKSDDGFAFGNANRRFWEEFGKCVSLEQQQQPTTVQRRWGQRANAMRADAVPAHEPTPEEPSAFFWSSAKPTVPFQQIPLPAQSADASFSEELSRDPVVVLQQSVACMLRDAKNQYNEVCAQAITSIAAAARDPDAQPLLLPGIPVIVALLNKQDVDLWGMNFFAAVAIATLLTAHRVQARELVLTHGGHELLLKLVERSTMAYVLREAGRALVALGEMDAGVSALRVEAIHKLTTFKAADADHALRAIGIQFDASELESVAADFLAQFDATARQIDAAGALSIDAYLKVTTYKSCEDVRELGQALARLK